MIFSTLALVIGFLALTTSGFMPTVSFGWLSCLTLIGGLVGNLVILPVLLAVCVRWIIPGCHAAADPEGPPPAITKSKCSVIVVGARSLEVWKSVQDDASPELLPRPRGRAGGRRRGVARHAQHKLLC